MRGELRNPMPNLAKLCPKDCSQPSPQCMRHFFRHVPDASSILMLHLPSKAIFEIVVDTDISAGFCDLHRDTLIEEIRALHREQPTHEAPVVEIGPRARPSFWPAARNHWRRNRRPRCRHCRCWQQEVEFVADFLLDGPGIPSEVNARPPLRASRPLTDLPARIKNILAVDQQSSEPFQLLGFLGGYPWRRFGRLHCRRCAAAVSR
jgi:hypothetical protein